MPFMTPYYYEDSPLSVETTCGTFIIPSNVCDSDDYETLADYVEGTIQEVSKLPKGIVFRLSANGYMDCTDWGYAGNIEEAKALISEMYDCDPDTGEELTE